MNIKNKLVRAAAIAAAAVGIVGLSLPSVAWASTAQSGAATAVSHNAGPVPQAINGPIACAFQTKNTGNYVTAVGGGGLNTDVIHTNATRIGAWERFTLIDSGDGHYGYRTSNGHYLTAVGGGGRNTDVIHSDATVSNSWEAFHVYCGI